MYFKVFLASVILSNSVIGPLSAQDRKPKSFSATSSELIGLWAGEGEVIEFRSDGKCRYGGELFEYQLADGYLLIHTPSGKVSFAYVIFEDKLNLAADGQLSTYARMTSPEKLTPVKADARNPTDLVGKWCYLKNSAGAFSNRCITLRANGTFLFVFDVPSGGELASDSGSWFVDKDKLYYQSALRGSGSYKLERRNSPSNPSNPMIVLDDEPFVTTGTLR